MSTSSVSVWVVLRKSRDEEQDPHILAKHRATLTRLLCEDGHDPTRARWVEEIGSSESIDRRPEFRAALQEWQQLPRRHGGLVYAMDWDRVSKGPQSQQGLIQDTMRRAGLILRTPAGHFDLWDVDDDFQLDAKGFIGRAEQRLFRKRVNEARVALVRDGRHLTGGASFGYDWDYKRKVPVPNEDFPVLKAMLRDALYLSTYALAEKYGKTPAGILYILRNPKNAGYCAKKWFPHHGERIRQRDGTDRKGNRLPAGSPWRGLSERVPPDQWQYPEKPGQYEAAITWDEFLALQRVLDERRDKKAKTDAENGWAVGVVRFVGQEAPVRLGVYAYPGHRTLTYESPRKGKCRFYIARDLVHEYAEAALLKIVSHPEKVMECIQGYVARQQSQAVTRASGADLAALLEEQRQEQQKLDAVNERLLLETDPQQVASFTRLQKQIRQRLAALEAKAADLRRPAGRNAHLEEIVPLVTLDVLRCFPDFWQECDSHLRRVCAQAFLQEVLCVCEPAPRGRKWQREVVSATPNDLWLPLVST